MANTAVPNHLGLILDGNRRWAVARGLKTLEGHKAGAENFKKISLAAFQKGVKYVSAYVFSTENWQRTKDEVSYLMKLLVRAVELHLDEFHQNNIKIITIGSMQNVPESVIKAIARTEAKTAKNTGGTLVLCFNYGGKAELVDAVKKIVASGAMQAEVTEQMITDLLYHPEIPPVDLLIRTSGEQRTSGFMMWRSDYAELLFVDTFWPDFSKEELDHAFEDFASRKRRFGK